MRKPGNVVPWRSQTAQDSAFPKQEAAGKTKGGGFAAGSLALGSRKSRYFAKWELLKDLGPML